MKRKTYLKLYPVKPLSGKLLSAIADKMASIYMRTKLLDDGILMIDLYHDDGQPKCKIFFDNKRLDFDIYLINENCWSKSESYLYYYMGHVTSIYQADRDRLLRYMPQKLKSAPYTRSDLDLLKEFVDHCTTTRATNIRATKYALAEEAMAIFPSMPDDFFKFIDSSIRKIHPYKNSIKLVCSYIDRLSDGRVGLRYFECIREYGKNEFGDQICTYAENTEHIRLIFDDEMKEIVKYDRFEHSGYQRFYDPTGWHKRDHYSIFYKKVLLYPGNLQEVLGDSIFKYSGIDLLANNLSLFNPLDYLILYIKYPQLEYFVKCGLHKYVIQVTKSDWDGNCALSPYSENPSMKLNEFFGVSKTDFKMLVALNPSQLKLDMYCQYLKNPATSFTELKWLESLHLSHDSFNVLAKISSRYSANIKQMINYIKKESHLNKMTISRLISFYNDYVNMADQLGLDLSHLQILMPYQLIKRHDELSFRIAKNKEKVETEQRIRDNAELSDLGEQLMTTYGFESDDLIIRTPLSIEDFELESDMLGNCVGRDRTYINKHRFCQSYIFFVRKKEQPDMPYFTMEYSPEKRKVLQLEGVRHCLPSDSVSSFVDEWKKLANKKSNLVIRRHSSSFDVKNSEITLLQQCG